MKLDDKDEEILRILRKNARTSNVGVAKAIGLTEGAVRRRIENLVSSGVISRFTIETRRGASFAIVMVKATKETKRMMADIAGLAVAADAYEISGDYDGCLVLEGATMEEIDGKIDRVRSLPSVADTKTFMAFRHY